MAHFQCTLVTASTAGSFLAAGMYLVGTIAGAIMDKYGGRATVTLGSGLCGTSLLICALGLDYMSFEIFTFLLFLASIGFGLEYLPGVTSQSFYFKKKQALATGISLCGTGIGIAMIPHLVIMAGQFGGLKAVMYLYAGLGYLGLLVVMIMPSYNEMEERRNETRSGPKDHRSGSFAEAIDILVEEAEQSGRDLPEDLAKVASRRVSLASSMSNCPTEKLNLPSELEAMAVPSWTLIKYPGFLAICIMQFMTFGSCRTPMLFLPELMAEKGPAIESDIVMACIGIGNVVGRLMPGVLIRDDSKVGPLGISNIALALSGILTPIFPYCNSNLSFSLLGFVWGLLMGLYVVLVSPTFYRLYSLAHINFAFGTVSVFQGVAQVVIPICVGYIHEFVQDFVVTFLTGGLIFLSAALFGLLAAFLNKKNKF